MATCLKCDAEMRKGDAFCHSCSTQLTTRVGKSVEKQSHAKEREMRSEERKRPSDYLGLISFGIVIVVVGFLFLINPNLIANFGSWIEDMAKQKTLLRPPQGLINSAILFFAVIGVSSFFIGGVRFMSDRVMRRLLADISTGTALVLFSYLIYLYGTHALAWHVVLAAEAVVIGILIIIYSALRFLFPKKLQ